MIASTGVKGGKVKEQKDNEDFCARTISNTRGKETNGNRKRNVDSKEGRTKRSD